MEDVHTRRRIHVSRKVRRPLWHQLIILLRSHKEMRGICTGTSVALRVVILCDLALQKKIAMDSNKRVISLAPGSSNIENEFLNKAVQAMAEPRTLIRILNGEKSKSLAIKHLRSKVCKEMEAQGLLRTTRTILYSKVVLENTSVWSSVISELIDDCRTGCPSTHTTVLLIALSFINKMESLLLQCSEQDAKAVVDTANSKKKEILELTCTEDERLVYEFLRCLIV